MTKLIIQTVLHYCVGWFYFRVSKFRITIVPNTIVSKVDCKPNILSNHIGVHIYIKKGDYDCETWLTWQYLVKFSSNGSIAIINYRMIEHDIRSLSMVYRPMWALFSFRSTFWRISDFRNISRLWCKKHEFTLLSFQICSFHSKNFENSLREAISTFSGVISFTIEKSSIEDRLVSNSHVSALCVQFLIQSTAVYIICLAYLTA